MPFSWDNSTAVDRETAWLNTTGDTLPALPAPQGPWEAIQGYWPRPLQTKQTGIYVLRPHLAEERWANIRRIDRYAFLLRLIWPVRAASGLPQDEQRNFDAAIGLLIQRVRGLTGDKTHGGRFLAAGEVPAGGSHLTVDYTDPDTTLGDGYLKAELRYLADDPDFAA